MAPGVIRHVRAEWRDAVLVCSKCSKKLGGGFGAKGKTGLAKALRKALRIKAGRRSAAGIVEVKCLGVCPKRAVTIARSGSDWLIVPAGTSVGRVALELGLAGPRAANDHVA